MSEELNSGTFKGNLEEIIELSDFWISIHFKDSKALFI